MKNVKGKEIYTTQEEKLAFYNSTYCNELIPGPQEFFLGTTPVKDDYFNDVLIPFCRKNNVQRVLDVGADFGKYSAKFINNVILDIRAVEITQERTKRLRNILDMYEYEIIKTECMDIEFPSGDIGEYDLIFLSDILEHLDSYFSVWDNCVKHAKFVYALIPKKESWSWSDDHLWSLDDFEITELITNSYGVINCDVIDFDEDNSWYALLVKGKL